MAVKKIGMLSVLIVDVRWYLNFHPTNKQAKNLRYEYFRPENETKQKKRLL